MQINKTKIIPTIVSVAVSTLLVAGAVFAVTTISTSIVTEGNLQVDGNSTLGTAVADDTVILKSRIATSSATGAALNIGATYDKGEGVELKYDVSDWTLVGTDFVGFYTRTGVSAAAAGKTVYGAKLHAANAPVGAASGYNVGTLRGAYIEAETKPGAATIDIMRGLEVVAGISATNTAVTSFQGIRLNMITDTPIGTGHGLVIRDEPNVGGEALAAAIYVENYSPTTWTGYTYGLDFSGAKIGTAEIRLQNGETISNATDGVVAISGNLKIASPATLTVTGTDPGTQVKLMYTASEAITNSWGGMLVSATAMLGATGGVTGSEFKAKANTSDTVSGDRLGTLRGIISTADARKQKVGTMYGVEANLSSLSGADVTTAIGLYVSQQLTHLGTPTYGSIYGISIKADNVANTADIQLSGGVGNPTNRPTIMSGSDVPNNATCTETTNRGSLYINTAGTAAADTILYLCEENGNWVAIVTP